MEKYLYLSEHSHVDAWVYGGEVPFFKTSKYKDQERKGIFTPDENLIDTSTFDFRPYSNAIFLGDNIINGNVSLTVDGVEIVRDAKVNKWTEDGLVVCFANRRSRFIAKKLEKKACVRVLDVELLKTLIDVHVGSKGEMDFCKYTKSHNRNHFLKSDEDSWQDEFRLFWKDVEPIKLILPPGIAVLEFYR